MSARPRRSAIPSKPKSRRKCRRRFFSDTNDVRFISTNRLHRCLRCQPLSSLDFQLNVAEPNFGRPAGVKLQGEDATAAACLVGEVDAFVAVEPRPDMVANSF